MTTTDDVPDPQAPGATPPPEGGPDGEKTRIEKPFDLEPGTYVFEVTAGPTSGSLTRADGSVISIGKEGGKETLTVRDPERVIVSYEANGRPPSGITLQKIG